MKRYWDFSERERSELTSDEVRKFLDRELMEKGVSRVEEPQLLPVEFPEIPKQTVWVVKNGYSTSDMAWESADEAAKASRTSTWIRREYIGGESMSVLEPKDLSVEAVQVVSANDFLATKQAREQAAGNKKTNDELLSDYNAAHKCVTEACEGVWDDWNECCAKARRYQRIIDARAEYVGLCDGNESLADTFLEKTFSADDVFSAKDWFGLVVHEAIESAS